MKADVKFLFAICCWAWACTSCQKEYSDENILQDATGTLSDPTGHCIYDSVAGTFYAGVRPDKDTDYIEVNVNVTSAGIYHISTDIQNGLRFADSGTFTSTGMNTVRLRPVGVPTLQATTIFTANFGASSCPVAVEVKHVDPNADHEWQFSTPERTISGALDTAFFGDSALWQGNGKMICITGYTSSARDSAFVIWIYLPTGAIAPGDYPTATNPPVINQAFFVFFKNAMPNGGGDAVYESSEELGSYTHANMLVTIVSHDTNKNIVTGTFSGAAEMMENGNDMGKTVNITNGSFTAPVAP